MEKNLMIRTIYLAIAFLLLSVPAFADTRDVYTITDIPVDERAESVLEAQKLAFQTARVIGVQRLISRITLPEHRQRATLNLDPETAQRMAAAVDVQEESRGGGRYRGTLAAVINPREIRPYLQAQGIPFLDRQAPVALVIPVAGPSDAIAWREAWGDRQDTTLSPTVTAIGNYPASVGWDAIRSELSRANAQRGIVAELIPGGAVRLTQVTAGGNTSLGTTGSSISYEAGVQKALAKLEDTWKRQAIVSDTSSKTLTRANVLYTSLPEWHRLRGSLAQSPLVSDFQIRAISTSGALVSFAFAGSQSQLERDLRQRGLTLERQGAEWVMRSAISGLR